MRLLALHGFFDVIYEWFNLILFPRVISLEIGNEEDIICSNQLMEILNLTVSDHFFAP